MERTFASPKSSRSHISGLSLRERKDVLVVAIGEQMKHMEVFDEQGQAEAKAAGQPAPARDEALSNIMQKTLSKMKNELEELRLRGDIFEVWDVVTSPPVPFLPKKLGAYSRFRLQISECNDISICVSTVRPDPVLDTSEMLSQSDEIEVKINELEDGFFEVVTVFSRRGIEDFRMLKLAPPSLSPFSSPTKNHHTGVLDNTTPTILLIEWKDGSKWQFGTSEALEMQEVLAAHLRKWKSEMKLCAFRLQMDWERCKEPYSSTNPDHIAMLMRLWCLVFSKDHTEASMAEAESRFVAKGHEWKELGFQRDDPASDFRGMGLLGLDHLLYIASRRRERFQQIIERHRRVKHQIENSYPLASAGINVTNMLVSILTISPSRTPNFHDSSSEDPLWSSLLLPFLTYCGYKPESESHVLEEIYCEVLILLDRTFEAQNAGYMDFPRIIDQTKQRLIELLARRPRSIATLRAWFDQLHLGL